MALWRALLFYDIYIRCQVEELFIIIRKTTKARDSYFTAMYCKVHDLIFGDKHDTNELFLDPELFLDLAPLLLLDMEGEAGDRLGEAREWAELAACRVKSSSSAESTMVGEVHLQVIMSIDVLGRRPDDSQSRTSERCSRLSSDIGS